ncbi:RibD family protein [Floridanema evergladense]|uniref:RibD family protein n=1 Tax=Floridaenema evergladense BLCC-F167 TaxID=3153639 RepID=A0ABV4WX56_9CYAN
MALEDNTTENSLLIHRPHTVVVLAMSADGKISDVARSPAGFGSPADQKHLMEQVAQADGLLWGARTLRVDGNAESDVNSTELGQQQNQKKSSSPVQIICTRSGEIDPKLKFFQQPEKRWLLTTSQGAKNWQNRSEFERILVAETETGAIDLVKGLEELASLNIKSLVVLGGGELIASLLKVDLIDEFWLTVCPFIFGGAKAPTPVDGEGFSLQTSPRLELLSVERVAEEIFIHYRVKR